MSRYTGPTTRINRRFGMALFPANKAFERRAYPPGQHGPSFRRKVSDYGQGLIEKQKLRMMYGLTEKQFRNMFERAKSKKGVTGEAFLTMLETRLDNVVYRLGFAKTRQAARQFVNHGHLLVNGKKVDIPSYFVAAGDVIGVREKSKSLSTITHSLERNSSVYEWLTWNNATLEGTFVSTPLRLQIPENIKEQLIVELYSK